MSNAIGFGIGSVGSLIGGAVGSLFGPVGIIVGEAFGGAVASYYA